ncbi:MAG: radical SAM protein [Saprospiraceae bacterium]|nr:radical SAM protein [Lewinella sp.]
MNTVSSSAFIRSSLRKKGLRLCVLAKLVWIALRNLKSAGKARQAIRGLQQRYLQIFGDVPVNKLTRVDGRYFWRLTAPGFPSRAHSLMFENELNKEYPFKAEAGLRTLFLAITRKCPLNCEHCFEWNNLHQKEALSLDELQHIVRKYQEYGTTQIMLSGGEPLVRFKDLLAILQQATPGTDFWVITSGFHLTEEKAHQLKAAGLTGVMISMEHHLEAGHNRFRGYDQAYSWATRAAVNARKAGLVTALSLCAARAYTNEANLTAYMEMAKELGVTFVQLLEPRAAGRYFGKDVDLHRDQIELLERFYLEYSTLPQWADYPIVSFVGYLQRRNGCMGGGDQYMYIDANGEIQVCPFCHGNSGQAVDLSVQEAMDMLSKRPCQPFEMSHEIQKNAELIEVENLSEVKHPVP